MKDRVKISIEAQVADVVLNRADKMNAVDMKMFLALGEAADRLANDKTVRAVVLRGAGENFCAGIDLSLFSETGLDFHAALKQAIHPSAANLFQRAAYAWRELPIPVICAIEGVAYGAGLQIALGADIRYASPEARLSVMESRWGMIPDMGISTTLRHLVPPDRVKELSWSARVLDSAEAKELGLITAVVEDPLIASRKLAMDCAARSPDAIRGIKALVNKAWQASEADALALEASLQGDIIGNRNQLEAVQASLAKRKPDFVD